MNLKIDRFTVVSILILIVICLLAGVACNKPAYHITNPYEGVDWAKYGQYKANLHTHTSVGDADATPQDVIDMYRSLGYSILAITDHDDNPPAETTWPWTAYGRDPTEINMVAIEGNEISGVPHIGSLFNDYGDPDVPSENDAFLEIGYRNGLAIINHPGRYNKRPHKTIAWYVDVYRRHDHLIGMEIFSKNDRYPGDRQLWDAVLSELSPDKNVWGLGNDDMHVPKRDLGYSWNVFVLPELTEERVREALEKGCFFYAHSPKGHHGSIVPTIDSIIVNEQKGVLLVKASDHQEIKWVSMGKIVHKGERLDLADLPNDSKYVRVEVYSADSTVVGTQPFSF